VEQILVVEDDLDSLEALVAVLATNPNYQIVTATNSKNALEILQQTNCTLLILDVQLPGISGLEICRLVKGTLNLAHIPVILISGSSNIEIAVEAMNVGAFYFLSKPINVATLLLLVQRALEESQLQRELAELRNSDSTKNKFGNLFSKNSLMQNIFHTISKIANSNATVLIEGDSGTGKELIARAIHDHSQRSGDFVAVDCGAFNENLLESDLFGHVKGAFTGAANNRQGVFAIADQGTIFLDEISNLPAVLQCKLLRVLQEHEIMPLGSNKAMQLDVRVIVASNIELAKMVAAGTFRQDLYFRLNVINIKIPSLQERLEDIPLLAQDFLDQSSTNKRLSPQALKLIMNYAWPGNVRELKNAISHACVVSKKQMIEPQDLPDNLSNIKITDFNHLPPISLKEMECQYIQQILKYTGYNKNLAAKILQIDRKTLWRKLKDLEINDQL